ncbi:NrfD/PsrC family molybdoenzyme membrane anchor subunit [Anaeromyxobacter sp. Fw109-5]|uniref:NrfD/PsrC family molybdoenzyme membrane anchor subunit n=1 Tax=Anaeromyxobacter sp. (strain Fw109-5) TaxID=404589 RepID=UPI0000ED70F3|nr:Ni/Fe-hydrogenase cytochrome b subunit [Anaeromyxobacter sp. Fw109-5]ABS27702.1 Polysulphide reductase NrfD [Anaeromyxobacter sp. Fw109-5]
MTTGARAVGGRLLTPTFKLMLVLWAAATAVGVVRFTQGLGAVTALNDGYPWGLWIAFDVVVGTGLASGGYAIALLVYVLNRGRYHPLVRPAILTSALGYSVAGIAVMFDVGRYWALWKVPAMPWRWNTSSILLEVALCIMAYLFVLLVELSPALLERWAAERHLRRQAFAVRWLPRLARALPFVIALGLVLPTMHQSSLGSLLVVAGTKVHPLWHTGALPLLFLLTAFGMGYAVLYFETIFSNVAFRRPLETKLLGSLGVFIAGVILVFVAVRFAGLMGAGRLRLTVTSGTLSFFFWAETLLLLSAAGLFLQQWIHASPATQLQAALLALAGGALYRVDAFLVAFQPGHGWRYFPSVGELLITLGFIATETMVYILAVRRFPILAGVSLPEPRRLPAGLKEGAAS